MFQTKMYVKELLDYLNTVTIKNELIAEQILNTWVNDFYRDYVRETPELNPYYRNLTGDYVLKDLSAVEQLLGIDRTKMTSSEYVELQPYIVEQAMSKYGLTDKTIINGKLLHNRDIYTGFNELVTLTSMDTQEEIPLTKTVVASLIHVKTVASYKIPSENYYTLCDKNPESASIIKSILYPIPDKLGKGKFIEKTAMDIAIGANNLDLLNSDLSILEENEQASMIECIHNTLAYIKSRWCVKEFAYEDLYPVAHEAIVWHMLFLVMNIQRIQNIKTHSAHSYHVWEYLKSHGFGDYRTFLTKQQTMFLYKNLPYLLKRKGTEKVLELLSYVLLNPWNIRLNNKIITQQTNDYFNNKLPFKESTIPIVNVISKRVGEPMFAKLAELTSNISIQDKSRANISYQDLLVELEQIAGTHSDIVTNITETTQYESLQTLLDKERNSELEYQDDNLYERSVIGQNKLLSRSPHNLLKTKILEITSPVNSLVFETLYARFITQQILYRASTDSLKFAITFMPAVSDTFVTMSAKDAIAVMLYAILKSKGFSPEYAPEKAMITMAYNKDYNIITDMITNFNTGLDHKCSKGILRLKSDAQAVLVTNADSLNGTYVQLTSANVWERIPTTNVISLTGLFDTHVDDINTVIENVNTKLNRVWNTDAVRLFSISAVTTDYIDQVFSGVTDPLALAKLIVQKIYNSDGTLIFGDAALQYNSKNKRWEFIQDNKVVLYSPNVRYYESNMFTSGVYWDLFNFWYDVKNNRTKTNVVKVLNPTTRDRYVLFDEIDTHLEAYSSVEDFSTSVHQQGVSYVSMMAEAGIIASNKYVDFISGICKTNTEINKPGLFVNEVVSLNLLNGSAYKEYFALDPVLAMVLSNIEIMHDPTEGYSKLANAILDGLYPIIDNLKRDDDYTISLRYKKLKELFINMCSYNVAFLETENINVMPYTMRVNTAQEIKREINTNCMISIIEVDTVYSKTHTLSWNDMNSILVREYIHTS